MIQMIQVRQRTRLGQWIQTFLILASKVPSRKPDSTPRSFYPFAFHNVVRASVLDERPASIIVRRTKYPPINTSSEMTIHLPLRRLPERPPNSECVWGSQDTANPRPTT